MEPWEPSTSVAADRAVRPDCAECLDRTDRPDLDRADNVALLIDPILCPPLLGCALLGLLLSKGLSVFQLGHRMVLLSAPSAEAWIVSLPSIALSTGALGGGDTHILRSHRAHGRCRRRPDCAAVEAVPGRCLTDRGGVRTPSAALIAASPRSLGPHAFSWIALAFAVATDCINAGR